MEFVVSLLFIGAIIGGVIIIGMLSHIQRVQEERANRIDKALQKLREEVHALHLMVYGKTYPAHPEKKEAPAAAQPQPQPEQQQETKQPAEKPKPEKLQPEKPPVQPPSMKQPAAQPVRQQSAQPFRPAATQRTDSTPGAKYPARQQAEPLAEREPSELETQAATVVRKIWNWIIITG